MLSWRQDATELSAIAVVGTSTSGGLLEDEQPEARSISVAW
jgi:hypothetical protein